MSTADLKDASLDQLVASIDSNAARLQTVKATVDIDVSLMEKNKGGTKEKELPQFSGYVRVRKPQMLRMIVLVPVVRNTGLDMVSNGRTFELSYPSKNQFFVGSNQVSKHSPVPIENVRPQHILDALLIKAIDAKTEKPVLQQGLEVVKDPKTHKDVQQPDYEVLVIATDKDGDYLERKIVFSRTDLLPHEQLIYNRQGEVVTDARYENIADHGGIMFPEIISIQRPIEQYTITLAVLKLNLNEPLPDDQFVLAQPPGSKLIDVDNQQEAQHQSSLRRSPERTPAQ